MKSANGNEDSLCIQFQVEKPIESVFEAILEVRNWWIGDVSGQYAKVGDSFRYSYKTYHDSTQTLVKIEKSKTLVWLVTKSFLSFVDDPNEWLGTQLIFELKQDGDGTLVVFTHKGLTPQSECYENCSLGWQHYILTSLKNYIEHGEGIDPQF